jgi:hypothetical protein
MMVNAFDGVYLLMVNVDDWGWEMEDSGFVFRGIPVFFKLDADGNPTGEVVDANAWNENIPINMAPVMDEFFHGN